MSLFGVRDSQSLKLCLSFAWCLATGVPGLNMSSGEGVHVFLKFQYLVLSKCVWPIGRSGKLTGSRIQIGQLDSGAASVAAGQCEKS